MGRGLISSTNHQKICTTLKKIAEKVSVVKFRIKQHLNGNVLILTMFAIYLTFSYFQSVYTLFKFYVLSIFRRFIVICSLTPRSFNSTLNVVSLSARLPVKSDETILNKDCPGKSQLAHFHLRCI